MGKPLTVMEQRPELRKALQVSPTADMTAEDSSWDIEQVREAPHTLAVGVVDRRSELCRGKVIHQSRVPLPASSTSVCPFGIFNISK